MPRDKPVEEVVQKCQRKGKPGYKYGESGKCYIYDPDDEQSRKDAKKRAIAQGVAIRKSQNMQG